MTWPRCFSILFALVGLASSAGADAQTRALQASDVVRSVENHEEAPSGLVLANGQRFQMTLHEVKVLGALRTKRKIPFLVLSGRGCIDCDANTSIYIHSPSDGAMKNEGDQTRYSYPGRLVSYEDNKTLMSETRTFLGSCLDHYEDAVVWFDRYRNRGGRFESGVLIVHVGPSDAIETVRLKAPLPDVSSAVQRVRQGMCRELPGINGSTEP